MLTVLVTPNRATSKNALPTKGLSRSKDRNLLLILMCLKIGFESVYLCGRSVKLIHSLGRKVRC